MRALEKILGGPLPGDYADFLARVGGAEFGDGSDVTDAIGRVHDVMVLHGYRPNTRGWQRPPSAIARITESLVRSGALVPHTLVVADDRFGNAFVLAPSGEVYWLESRGVDASRSPGLLVAPSFLDFCRTAGVVSRPVERDRERRFDSIVARSSDAMPELRDWLLETFRIERYVAVDALCAGIEEGRLTLSIEDRRELLRIAAEVGIQDLARYEALLDVAPGAG